MTTPPSCSGSASCAASPRREAALDLSTVAAVVLGVVFLASGILKLADRQWPAEARQLGVPVVVARIVPVAEVVLGAALVAGRGAAAVAWPALAFLGAATAVLVVNLRRGRRPVCACFGGLSRRPIGWGSVARNAALAVVAVLAAL